MDWNWLLLSREGRVPRKIYWLYYVVPVLVISLVLNVVDMALGFERVQPLSLFFTLLAIWPSICVGAKRCHDRNKSAWWILITFIPVIGIIWWIIEFGCLRGTVGPNRFGPDPIAPEALASPA